MSAREEEEAIEQIVDEETAEEEEVEGVADEDADEEGLEEEDDHTLDAVEALAGIVSAPEKLEDDHGDAPEPEVVEEDDEEHCGSHDCKTTCASSSECPKMPKEKKTRKPRTPKSTAVVTTNTESAGDIVAEGNVLHVTGGIVTVENKKTKRGGKRKPSARNNEKARERARLKGMKMELKGLTKSFSELAKAVTRATKTAEKEMILSKKLAAKAAKAAKAEKKAARKAAKAAKPAGRRGRPAKVKTAGRRGRPAKS